MRAETIRRASSALGIVALTLLLAAGLRLAAGGASPPPPRPEKTHEHASPSVSSSLSPAAADGPDHLIGTAAAELVVARADPRDDAPPIAEFPRINEQGAPQTFLLLTEERGPGGGLPEGQVWVEALLPVRPNGTTGFIRVEDLQIVGTDYRIVVEREHFRLTLYEGDEVVMRTEVGIGAGETPTPVGTFYLTSLLQPPTNNTVYGSYAYGLSGFSEDLTDWEGEAIIGLHGTNDPASVGRQVSAGCIRMRNEDIEQLVPELPLGTPIEIV